QARGVARAVRGRRRAGRELGRRTSSGAGPRGGDDIPALRENRLRVATAALTLALFAAFVAYPATATHRLPLVVGGIAAAAWLLLLFALVGGWGFVIAWVLVAAGSVRSGLALEALGVLGAALVVAAVVRIAARTRGAPPA